MLYTQQQVCHLADEDGSEEGEGTVQVYAVLAVKDRGPNKPLQLVGHVLNHQLLLFCKLALLCTIGHLISNGGEDGMDLFDIGHIVGVPLLGMLSVAGVAKQGGHVAQMSGPGLFKLEEDGPGEELPEGFG